MALWGLSVTDIPSAAECKTAMMASVSMAGRETMIAGRETTKAKPDFFISGFEIKIEMVAAKSAPHADSLQLTGISRVTATKILAFCYRFS